MAALFKTSAELMQESRQQLIGSAAKQAQVGQVGKHRGLSQAGASIGALLGGLAGEAVSDDDDRVAAGDITQGVDVTSATELRAKAKVLAANQFDSEATELLKLARDVEASERLRVKDIEGTKKGKLDALKEPTDNQLKGAHNLFFFSQGDDGQPDEFGEFVQDVTESGAELPRRGLEIMARSFSQTVNEVKVELDASEVLAPQSEIEDLMLVHLKNGKVAEDGTWFGGLFGERTLNRGNMTKALASARSLVLAELRKDAEGAGKVSPVQTAPDQATTEVGERPREGVKQARATEVKFDTQGRIEPEIRPGVERLPDEVSKLSDKDKREIEQIDKVLSRIGKDPVSANTIKLLEQRKKKLLRNVQ